MPPFAPFSRIRKLRQLFTDGDHELSPLQRRMYAAETQMNFRTIAKLCATRSSYILAAKDLASAELSEELAEIGQFAEMAYPTMPASMEWEYIEALSRADFPLERYTALHDSILVSSLDGDVAEFPGLVAYRPQLQQAVVAFSGTCNSQQAWYDLRFRKRRHPAGGGCKVHSGFWQIYKGIKREAVEGLQKCTTEHKVKEIVVTGHSLGGTIAALFALDLLTSDDIPRAITEGISLTVVGFGSPRAGNSRLVSVWRDAVRIRREKEGESSVREYLIKAYNDGVPALPPAKLGFRHFAARPLYFYHGRLFHVPASESEHGTFKIAKDALDSSRLPDFPRGGHNYYSSRDLERLHRHMQWIGDVIGEGPGWESRYLAVCAEGEEKLLLKPAKNGRVMQATSTAANVNGTVNGSPPTPKS